MFSTFLGNSGITSVCSLTGLTGVLKYLPDLLCLIHATVLNGKTNSVLHVEGVCFVALGRVSIDKVHR